MKWYLVAVFLLLALYAGFAIVLLASGRRTDARALAGFVPDCIVMFSRLARDDLVPRRKRVALVALVAYLSLPFDLIPDFIPVIGLLDDAIIAGLTLRWVLRDRSASELRGYWPGPQRSFDLVVKLAGAG